MSEQEKDEPNNKPAPATVRYACACGETVPAPAACPYRSEIFGEEALCTCCGDCAQACIDDI